MKINGCKVLFLDLQVEKIDDEMFVYNPNEKKIIVFNKTASLIWEMLTEYHQISKDITSSILADRLMETYEINSSEKDIIVSDVEGVIINFFDEKLIERAC